MRKSEAAVAEGNVGPCMNQHIGGAVESTLVGWTYPRWIVCMSISLTLYVCMSCAAPSQMIVLSPSARDRLSSDLQASRPAHCTVEPHVVSWCVGYQGILEAWYGKGPLELTSIYGVR